MNRSTVLKTIGVVIVLLLAFIAGAQVTAHNKNKVINELLVQGADLHTEIVAARNKSKDLTTIINKLETEQTSLKQLIRELKDRPAEVQYVTKVETVLVPEKEIVYVEKLPDNYVHKIQDIPVASFTQLADGYEFRTFELHFQGLIVTGNSSSTALLQVESSGDTGIVHEIPIELVVYKNKVRKVIEPHIGVGLTVSVPTMTASGSFIISWWHPFENLDAVSARISLNTKEIKLGLDLVSYNIGAHIPLLTDTWIGIGPDINQNLEPAGSITVWSKF